VTGCCEHGKETSGSIKCGEFLDKADGLLAFSRRTLVQGVKELLILSC